MNTNRPTSDEIFDAAVAAVVDEPIDPQALAAAQARVARRLDAELAPAEPGEVDHRIRGCEGFQALIPAYLAGALSEPKRILFEDHSRECVPCRRALNDAKKGSVRSADAAGSRRRTISFPRWALAAGIGAATLAGGWLLSDRLGLIGPDATAKVRAIDGELLLVADGRTTALAAGATVERGQVVRTSSGSSAVLALADGTEIELAARTELSLARRSDGVVIDVDRGDVIVEAAKQKQGHLYVATDEMTASVVGTIFAVDHGVRGSRVAVLEGEVHVRQGAKLAVLRSGDQHATDRQLANASFQDEFGWSRNSAEYQERITALASIGRELDRTIAMPASRTSTKLLDLAPAGTAIFVGLPNLSDQVGEAWQLLEQRVAENPALASWWAETIATGDANQIGDAIERLRQLGHGLGAELAVAVTLDAAGDPAAPVVMAEIVDRNFVATLDAEIAKLNAQITAEGHRAPVVRVASPAEAVGSDNLFVWIAGDGELLVASPSATTLAAVAASLDSASEFVGSPLHGRLADVYRGGAGWLLGIDAARVLSAAPEGEVRTAAFDRLGLSAAGQFVVESESHDGIHESRATLGFSGPRTGVASWLAPSAHSEALEFVSAEAQFAMAGLVKRPTAMFDDLWAAMLADAQTGDARAKLEELEAKLGFSLRDDLAAALGGDFAIAIDGPWLPKPSWKLVVELADPGRLDFVAQRAIESINSELEREGKPGVRLSQEESDGRLFFRLALESGVELGFATVVDGYLVAGPSKALVVQAIQHRAAGTTLVRSRAFLDRLPEDGETDFSAMVWQNLGGTVGQLAQLFASGALAPEVKEQVESMAADSGPTLIVAYGDRDEIRFATRGENGPLGFSFEKILTLLGAVAGEESGDDVGAADGASDEDETPAQATA